MTPRITLHIFRMTFALFIDAGTSYKSLIIEADHRDSEFEGTSCASMKLSAVVNSMRVYCR